MRKRLSLALALIGILLFSAATGFAADSATQVVTYEVQAINDITVSGPPGALIITSATGGADPDPVSDGTTTYSVTTNQTAVKIIGSIDTAMPGATTLKVQLTAPTAALSAGQVTLTTLNQNLVTGIDNLSEAGLAITYTFTATAADGVIASSFKTVTLTVGP